VVDTIMWRTPNVTLVWELSTVHSTAFDEDWVLLDWMASRVMASSPLDTRKDAHADPICFERSPERIVP